VPRHSVKRIVQHALRFLHILDQLSHLVGVLCGGLAHDLRHVRHALADRLNHLLHTLHALTDVRIKQAVRLLQLVVNPLGERLMRGDQLLAALAHALAGLLSSEATF